MSSRTLMALAATPALVALSVVLSAGTAQAARHDFHDGAGDVWRSDPTSAPTQVGTVRNVDVVSSTVTFNRTALRFVVRYASLEAGRFRASLTETVKRADGTYLNVAVETKDDARGIVTLDTRCPGKKVFVNYRDDLIRLTIPTSCVGKQAWVEVSGAAYGVLRNDDSEEVYADDLQDHGHEPTTYSARIRRG